MRYERLKDIVNLAIRLQGARGGLTMDDIVAEFGVSRRTAERMRNAVEAAFGPLQLVETGDRRIHWRLESTSLRRLVRITPDELAELESAANRLERAGLAEQARILRELVAKLLALRRMFNEQAFGDELEALMQAEGSAMRPGPRPHIEPGLLPLLRDAIRATRRVEFNYLARSSGRHSRQLVEPYGVLYGNRAYLVGCADWAKEQRLWSLGKRKQGPHYRRDVRARPRLRSTEIRRALLRRVSGTARGRRAAVRPRSGARCRDLPVPSQPDTGRKRGWLIDGSIQGRRAGRDVLASLYLGHGRYGGKACRIAGAAAKHVRRSCRTSFLLADIRNDLTACMPENA